MGWLWSKACPSKTDYDNGRCTGNFGRQRPHPEQSSQKTTRAKVALIPTSGSVEVFDKIEQKKAIPDTDYFDLLANVTLLQRQVKKYIADPKTATTPFKVNGNKDQASNFPMTFCLAAIRFGNDAPMLARGFVPIPKGKHICVYFYQCCSKWPDVLQKFGPNDINGLELVTAYPQTVLKKIDRWKALDELCFFNTLVKAPEGPYETYEESSLLPPHVTAIDDNLPKLHTLGLCGDTITGRDIAITHLFKTINCLKIKRITHLDQLLAALPARDNLQELWLVDCAER